MPGPAPKPTALRLVEAGGKLRTRFKRRAEAEPKPVGPLGEPPGYLTHDQLVVWFRLEASAAPGLLTASDRDLFESFVILAEAKERLCRKFNAEAGEILRASPDNPGRLVLVATLREYKRITEQLRVLSHEFGFTPAARVRLVLPSGEDAA